jgi:hypothetical protein
VGYRLLQVQAIDKPAQLTRRDCQTLLVVGIPGPMELALLQAPVMQPEAIGIPLQNLELVASPVAEDEPIRAHRIKFERLSHQRRRPLIDFLKSTCPVAR